MASVGVESEDAEGKKRAGFKGYKASERKGEEQVARVASEEGFKSSEGKDRFRGK